MTNQQQTGFEGWAILEVLGHRKLGGKFSEQTIAGVAFVRIDVPAPPGLEGDILTQFYAPGSIYCITPTTEEIARAAAAYHDPAPVTRYELRALQQPGSQSEPPDDVPFGFAADDFDGLDDEDE